MFKKDSPREEFYSEVRMNSTKADREKMLLYARSNESGISKHRIIESMKCLPNHEFSVETLALVETYELNFEDSNFWADYLKSTFPGNS